MSQVATRGFGELDAAAAAPPLRHVARAASWAGRRWSTGWCLLRLALLALLFMAAGLARAAEPAPASREAIEAIVRDYLLREPEVLYQALQNLQARRQAQEAGQRTAALRAHREAVFGRADDPAVGNARGDATLVEFFDYHCGYCRQMMPSLRGLVERDGGLRLVLKDLPILGPDSVTAAKAALAAQVQGRYADMHWALLQAKDLSQDGVVAVASGLGLDTRRLVADMESPAVRAAIDRNLELAQALGITGTPSFAVGDTLIPGAISPADLARSIEEARRGG